MPSLWIGVYLSERLKSKNTKGISNSISIFMTPSPIPIHRSMRCDKIIMGIAAKSVAFIVTASVDGEKTLNNNLIGGHNSHMNWCLFFCCLINALTRLVS